MFPEYKRDEPTETKPGGGVGRGVSLPAADEEAPAPDLIFDCTGLEEMRVGDLSLLLTAGRMARDEDRTVWAAGLPASQWRSLHAMGLDHLFRPFPVSEDRQI